MPTSAFMLVMMPSRAPAEEIVMPHSPEKVWRALTEAPLIAEWLMRNDFAPEPGRRFNFFGAPNPGWNGTADCEVLVAERPSRLSYRWCASGNESADGLMTVVTWTLTPTAAGVVVRMEQAGFREEENWNLQGAEYGWKRMLAALDQFVAGLD